VSPLAAPFAAGCVLLLASGGAKLRSPSSAAAALAGASLPSSTFVVRVWAAGEVAVGAWALSGPGWSGPAAVATTYLFLALFVVRAVRRKGGEPCGCFGADESSPSLLHCGVNGAFALTSAVVAAGRWDGLGAVLTRVPGLGVPLVVEVGAIALLAHTALTALPSALAAGDGRR
jgi:methylamine utilization protein MauE